MFHYLVTITFFLSFVIFIIMAIRGELFHPLNFIFLFWIVPVFLSSLHLSYFQTREWCSNTQITILISFFFLYYVPLVICLLRHAKGCKQMDFKEHFYRYFHIEKIKIIAYGSALLYIFLFFGENYFLTQTFFPIFYGIDVHTHSTAVLSLITRDPVFPVLILAFYYSVSKSKSKRRLSLFMVFLVVLLPILRGARYDSVLSLIAALAIIYFLNYTNRKSRRKFVLHIIIVIVLIITLYAYIGQGRTSQFGIYKISYAQSIGYKYNPGPFEIFATYYGNFPMSVENLDLFIRSFGEAGSRHTYFIYSLDFWFRGLFNFDNLFRTDWNFEEKYQNLRRWHTGAATVPTAFARWYMDLGPFAAVTPFLVLCLALWYYYKANKNTEYYLLYTAVMVGFTLISFTDWITTRATFENIILCYLLFSVAKKAPLKNENSLESRYKR